MSQRIKYEDYKAIQDLKRQGFNKNQTYLKTKIRKPTIHHYWDVSEEEYHKLSYDKAQDIEQYKEFLTSNIKLKPSIQDSVLLRKIFEEYGDNSIKKATFYRYTTKLREELGLERKNVRSFTLVPHRAPGELIQVDGGEYIMKDMYNNAQKVYFMVYILSHSRMKFCTFQTHAFNTNDLIDSHEKAFKYFGGRSQILMYDQAKIVVNNETAGHIIFTKEFEEYAKKQGFTIYLCRKRDPSTKGQVENSVRVIKMSFLQNREFCGVSTLNSEAIYWLDNIGNVTLNRHTMQSPMAMFENEKNYLIKVKPYININEKIATVDGTSSVLYKNNKYVLPSGLYNKNDKVLIKQVGNEVHIFDADTNELIISHTILTGTGDIIRKENFKSSTAVRDELLARFNNDERLSKLIEGIGQSRPRFIHDQCVLLRKLANNFTEQEFFESIEHCNKYQKFCATECIVYLVMKYSIERVAKVINYRTKYNYMERADKLQLELGGTNGNI